MPLSEARLNDIQMVTLNGVAADASDYKLGIGLGFTYIKPMTKEVAAFIDYLNSEAARDVMRQTGHTPATPHEMIVQALLSAN